MTRSAGQRRRCAADSHHLDVTVEDVDLRGRYDIVAICARDAARQAIPILDLRLPNPPPAGAEWIDAYRHWTA